MRCDICARFRNAKINPCEFRGLSGSVRPHYTNIQVWFEVRPNSFGMNYFADFMRELMERRMRFGVQRTALKQRTKKTIIHSKIFEQFSPERRCARTYMATQHTHTRHTRRLICLRMHENENRTFILFGNIDEQGDYYVGPFKIQQAHSTVAAAPPAHTRAKKARKRRSKKN